MHYCWYSRKTRRVVYSAVLFGPTLESGPSSPSGLISCTSFSSELYQLHYTLWSLELDKPGSLSVTLNWAFALATSFRSLRDSPFLFAFLTLLSLSGNLWTALRLWTGKLAAFTLIQYQHHGNLFSPRSHILTKDLGNSLRFPSTGLLPQSLLTFYFAPSLTS